MVTPTLDEKTLHQWLGKTEVTTDTIDARQANLMAATMGAAQILKVGDNLPPLWHWIYFLRALPSEDLGRDGHPKLGGFLPPVDLPRRMWAGGRFEFSTPLLLGDVATKTSRIEAIKLKAGRSGALCFVTVSHEITVSDRVCLREEHDIVYRQDPTPDAPRVLPALAPEDADWHRHITTGPVTLFRYSALTFNGHRIHYDREYCREVEGYPDLVVHGPLIATQLAGLADETRPDQKMRSFNFRALAPIFDTAPYSIEGKAKADASQLWAKNPDNTLAMQAEAQFA